MAKTIRYAVLVEIKGEWAIAYSGNNKADAERIQAREQKRGRNAALLTTGAQA